MNITGLVGAAVRLMTDAHEDYRDTNGTARFYVAPALHQELLEADMANWRFAGSTVYTDPEKHFPKADADADALKLFGLEVHPDPSIPAGELALRWELRAPLPKATP